MTAVKRFETVIGPGVGTWCEVQMLDADPVGRSHIGLFLNDLKAPPLSGRLTLISPGDARWMASALQLAADTLDPPARTAVLSS